MCICEGANGYVNKVFYEFEFNAFQLVEEFLRGFAHNILANVHVEILYGRDAHHMAEAVFKGLARALDAAMRIDPRVPGVPSTKESL
jgi:imidazoleglycerol-phosphate dehydratase